MSDQESVKQKVQQVFGSNAENFFTSETHAKGPDLSIAIDWLQPKSDSVALDIATGGGHMAKTLAPQAAHVFAADLTRQMLANTAGHLRETHPNIWYVVADAEALPFLDETFNIVTCRIAPHHFPNPDLFIKEAARVLKPGGHFLLIDNVAPEDNRLADFMNTVEKTRDDSHVRCLPIKEWRKLLVESGFSEKNSLVRKKTHDFPVWVKRTSTPEDQVQLMEKLLTEADEEVKEYFSVVVVDGKVQSLQIDDWMVLCQKC